MSSQLSNQDFRNLIRVVSEISTKPKENCPSKNSTAAKEKHHQKYLQILRRQKRREQQQAKAAISTTKFRDRAAERRNNQAELEEFIRDCQLQKHHTLEESKFLGGDEEHTHLVKGLDYVLLSKARADIEKKIAPASLKSENKNNNDASHKVLQIQQSSVSDANAQRILQVLTYGLHLHHIAFHQKLERVEKTIYRSSHFYGNTTFFSSKRSFYQFNVDPQSSSFPLSIIHGTSVEKTPKTYFLPLPDRFLQLIKRDVGCESSCKETQTLSTNTHSISSEQQEEKEDKANDDEKERNKADDDEDIFVHAGRFRAQDDLPLAIIEDESGIKGSTCYFSFNSMTSLDACFTGVNLTELHAPSTINQTRTYPLNQLNEKTSLAESGSKAPERHLKSQHDGYDECYPHNPLSLSNRSWNNPASEKTTATTCKSFSKTRNSFKDFKKEAGKGVSARATRRQAEREWKQIEGYIESKKHRHLNIIEEELARKTIGNNLANSFPNVL